MRITTKYNIGDRLWPVLRHGEKYHVGSPFDCSTILLTATKPLRLNGFEITYGWCQIHGFIAYDVFSNRASAKAACDRRNMKAKPFQPVPKPRRKAVR